MDKKQKVIQCILEEVQSILGDLRRNYEDERGQYGVPPASAIVRYHDCYDAESIRIGNILAVWQVTRGSIKSIDDIHYAVQCKPGQGVFYAEGNFWASMSEDCEYVILSWQVGPRYSVRTRYFIVDENGTINLKEDRILGIS